MQRVLPCAEVVNPNVLRFSCRILDLIVQR
jgi:hypothetical protein